MENNTKIEKYFINEETVNTEKETPAKKFSWGKVIVPVVVAVILIAFAILVYWDKVIKPAQKIDKEAGVKVEDYIEVGDITGLKYDITQQEWDEMVYDDTHYFEQVERAAQSTDQVDFNFTGYINNKKVEDLTMKEQSLDIDKYDSGAYKVFSDALKGLKSGEKVTVETDGKDASELSYSNTDYTGKKVKFELKVVNVNKLVEEKVTDEWVKENFFEDYGISTVDEFYEWEKECILEGNVIPELWRNALEKVTLKDIPIELQQKIIEELDASTEAEAKSQNMSVEEYKQFTRLTKEQMEENYTLELKSELLMWYLTKELKLKVSDEEIEEKYEEYYMEANVDSPEEMKELYTKKEMKEIALLEKAQDYVYKNAKIKYSYKIAK